LPARTGTASPPGRPAWPIASWPCASAILAGARTSSRFCCSSSRFRVSTSMVGRIVGQLKRHGRLREPPRSGVDRRALRARPYAIRKPKQYAVSRPGDLVQVDTLDVRPLPGIIFKQFTARDVVSRRDVIQAHTRATASTVFFVGKAHALLTIWWPHRVVDPLPLSQLAVEFLHLQRAGRDLIKLLGVSPLGALDRAVELGRSRWQNEQAQAALLAG